MNAVVMQKHEAAPVPPSSTSLTTTPSQLLAMAVQQGADLDRLERLMDLQQKWEANEARKQFAAALAAFKSEALELLKTKQVEFTTRDGDTTRYRHAELAVAASVAGAALAKHNLSFRWDVHQGDGKVTVDCILMHSAGHSERVTMTASPDASGKKNAIQQVASTVTYLERYTLLAITGMAAKDTDDDAEGAYGDDPPPAPPSTEPAPRAEWPDEAFAHQLERARPAIESGKRKPADVIAMLETKGLLTEAQRAAIFDYAPVEQEKGR